MFDGVSSYPLSFEFIERFKGILHSKVGQLNIKENDSVFSINKEYEFAFKNNFAIEAKLKNWKRALMQAYRYRWFAEYSYVVLDAYFSKPAIKNQSWFEKYNVGLATIDTNGKLIRHYNPIKQKPFDIKMQMLLSEKVKTQLALSK